MTEGVKEEMEKRKGEKDGRQKKREGSKEKRREGVEQLGCGNRAF